MIQQTTITENLIEVIEREKINFTQNGGTLLDVYNKFSKIGIDTKSNYSLPLKDTIGKMFNEQLQFKNH